MVNDVDVEEGIGKVMKKKKKYAISENQWARRDLSVVIGEYDATSVQTQSQRKDGR